MLTVATKSVVSEPGAPNAATIVSTTNSIHVQRNINAARACSPSYADKTFDAEFHSVQ